MALLFLTAVRWRPMGKSGANGICSAQGSSRKWQHPWHVCWGSFGSFKGRPKGNACLIVFAGVRPACKSGTWSLWTSIWLPFAICLLMQIYFPNTSLVRVDPGAPDTGSNPELSHTLHFVYLQILVFGRPSGLKLCASRCKTDACIRMYAEIARTFN